MTLNAKRLLMVQEKHKSPKIVWNEKVLLVSKYQVMENDVAFGSQRRTIPNSFAPLSVDHAYE